MKLPKNQNGTILIEALIAMLIATFTLLGLAALQVKSVKMSQVSAQRTIAMLQASDLVERMWSGICALPKKNAKNNSDLWVEGIFKPWEKHWQDDLRFSSWEAKLDATDAPNYKLTISWSKRIVESSDESMKDEFFHFFHIPVPIYCS